MSVVFNPPPGWRTYLPSNFVPESDWNPPPTWAPLPSDWALWVDSDSGLPVDTPREYEANTALNVPKPLSAVSSTPAEDNHTTNKRDAPGDPFSAGTAIATMPGVQHEASRRSRSRGKIFYLLISLASLAVAATIIYFAFGNQEANPTNNNGPSSAVGTDTQNTSDTSLGSSNALSIANDYLSSMALSSRGLQELLESSGYSSEEAQYAIAHVSADWNEHAIKYANQALENMPLSRRGLGDVLESSGFTEQQANHALKNITADWNKHAIKYANQALENMPLSRRGLGDVLESSGFTEQQANHALKNITADWNEHARRAAKVALEQSSFSKQQLIDYLEMSGFSRKQAEEGVQATGL
ncbi:Ltp family lipoprotein [Glutamicibacter ardleyensis]|uniref:Ltp family lipoprotein n=1 Tax=Glutamicibacter ardleyensis TaxID=225894 RepID=UPI003FD2787A